MCYKTVSNFLLCLTTIQNGPIFKRNFMGWMLGSMQIMYNSEYAIYPHYDRSQGKRIIYIMALMITCQSLFIVTSISKQLNYYFC